MVGNKTSFTIKGIQPGKYELIVGSRNLSSRPTYSAVVKDTFGNSSSFGSFNFADVSTVDPKNPTATYHRLTTGTEIGEIYSNGTLTLTFTITSTPASPSTTHIDSFKFVKIEEGPAVTLDGANLEVKDGKVSLPVSVAEGFIAYTDGTSYFAEGTELEVTEDLALKSVAIGAVTMQAGAAIRINVVNGIRFKTNVNISAIDEVTTLGATMQFGTLITVTDLLGSEELTLDASVSKQNVIYAVELGQTYNAIGFVGSIANIKTTNYNRNYIARGYVKVTLGDIEKVIYADDYTTTARSVASLADALIKEANDDSESVAADLYIKNKELIDAWAAAYVKEQ